MSVIYELIWINSRTDEAVMKRPMKVDSAVTTLIKISTWAL